MSATMNTDAGVGGGDLHCIRPPCSVSSDAGAHITQFSEAGQTSQLLGHWVREREALSLEAAVRRITSAPADIFGIPDRGRLAPGLAADVTVFDPATIACHEEEIVTRHAGRRAAVRPARQRHPVVLRQRDAGHPRRTSARSARGHGRGTRCARRVMR